MVENQTLAPTPINFNITNHQSNQQIVKAIASNLISSLSGGMFSLAMGLMLLNQTHSPISFGLETAITPLVGLICLVPVGNIVDQYPHKRILMISMAARLIGLLLFIIAFPFFNGLGTLIPVSAFIAIDAISTNFNTTTYAAAVHELVNDRKIPKLSSFTQAAASLSEVLSPVLGVALYALIGFEWFITGELFATTLALLITSTMTFHYPEKPATPQMTSQKLATQFATFKAGLVYVRSRALIRDMIITALVINFLFAAINIGLPFIITSQLHAGNAPIGILNTGFSAGMLIGSLLMSIFPANKHLALKTLPPMILLGSSLVFLGLLLMNTTQPTQISLVGALIMLLMGIMSATLNVSINVRLQTTVPTEILGRVITILTVSVSSIMPIGTLFYTFLFQHTTNGAGILVISGLLMMIYVASLSKLILRDIRRDTLFQK